MYTTIRPSESRGLFPIVSDKMKIFGKRVHIPCRTIWNVEMVFWLDIVTQSFNNLKCSSRWHNWIFKCDDDMNIFQTCAELMPNLQRMSFKFGHKIYLGKSLNSHPLVYNSRWKSDFYLFTFGIISKFLLMNTAKFNNISFSTIVRICKKKRTIDQNEEKNWLVSLFFGLFPSCLTLLSQHWVKLKKIYQNWSLLLPLSIPPRSKNFMSLAHAKSLSCRASFHVSWRAGRKESLICHNLQ